MLALLGNEMLAAVASFLGVRELGRLACVCRCFGFAQQQLSGAVVRSAVEDAACLALDREPVDARAWAGLVFAGSPRTVQPCRLQALWRVLSWRWCRWDYAGSGPAPALPNLAPDLPQDPLDATHDRTVHITGVGTDTVSLPETIFYNCPATGVAPNTALQAERKRYWMLVVRWRPVGWHPGQHFAVGAMCGDQPPTNRKPSNSVSIVWDSSGGRWSSQSCAAHPASSATATGGPAADQRASYRIDSGGPLFAGNVRRAAGALLSSEAEKQHWFEERLGFKLELERLSFTVLRTGATDSIELPESHRSRIWRPLVSLRTPCMVMLRPLELQDRW